MSLPRLRHTWARPPRLATLLALCCTGCGSLLPAPPPLPTLYALESNTLARTRPPRTEAHRPSAPTVVVNQPRALAGFDSAHIIYTQAPAQLSYFAHSEWVDTPARMLAPLLVQALSEAEGSGSKSYRAVVLAPSSAHAELALDTDIVRLQQEFDTDGAAQVRFTLRAALVDTALHRVVSSGLFEARVPAPTADPQGGVLAARQAVQQVLQALTRFCEQAVQGWLVAPPQPLGTAMQ